MTARQVGFTFLSCWPSVYMKELKKFHSVTAIARNLDR